MKLAIIADDLTGANDSGVQLARHGLKTAVLFEMDGANTKHYEAVVFDTDSRSIKHTEAYEKVKQAAQFLVDAGFDFIFKKLDSTMRGNIGAEIDAIYDVLKPHFMMIAPGYPKNNREIHHSTHYLNKIPLGETEIAKDPKTPVTISYLPDLLQQQTDRAIAAITIDDLVQGEAHIADMLKQYADQGIPYLIIDSTEEEHLQQILAYTKHLPYQFAWVGSAGIANYLPEHYGISVKQKLSTIPANNGPILTVVGSVNINSRVQLNKLLEEGNVYAIPFESYKALSSPADREHEISKVYKLAYEKAVAGLDVVIYSTAEQADIEQAWKVGEAQGLSHTEISNEIVKAIGNVCSMLLEKQLFKGVSMTGGDTAKQICSLWGIKGFELLDELEIGVPISKFLGIEHLHVITKAGGFGSERVFIHAINKLKGDHQ